MKTIPLSQGKSVVVDDEDHALLSEFKWCYRGERDSQLGYAVRHVKIDGKDRLCYLHRLLMNPPQGREVIFLNHDRLDCRRANLRVVTTEESRRHHRVRKDSKTGVKGVHYNEQKDYWSAYVIRNGKCHTIGTYSSKAQAETAYKSALWNEHPELRAAPAPVERPCEPESVQRAKEADRPVN